MVLDGPMDGPAFEAYVTQVLVPTLKPRDIVAMDNLAAHKRAEVGVAIDAAGAQLLYLPPYSPDPNPIEMAFAKLKAPFERPPQDQSRLWTTLLPSPWPPSPPKSASTSSLQPVMIVSDPNLL